MKYINLTFSMDQLESLVTLADNQLFRMKYIDPKMPGYKTTPEDLENARGVVQVLQEALKKMKGYAPGPLEKRQAGPDRAGLGK